MRSTIFNAKPYFKSKTAFAINVMKARSNFAEKIPMNLLYIKFIFRECRMHHRLNLFSLTEYYIFSVSAVCCIYVDDIKIFDWTMCCVRNIKFASIFASFLHLLVLFAEHFFFFEMGLWNNSSINRSEKLNESIGKIFWSYCVKYGKFKCIWFNFVITFTM